MREDKPFILRGGDTEQASLYNRVEAIKRIAYLSKIDLTKKEAWFLQLLDLEMYGKWYKEYPKDHKIDEEWCQRAAEVAVQLEKDREEIEKTKGEIEPRIEKVFQEHEAHAGLKPQNKPEQPARRTFMDKLRRVFKGEKND